MNRKNIFGVTSGIGLFIASITLAQTKPQLMSEGELKLRADLAQLELQARNDALVDRILSYQYAVVSAVPGYAKILRAIAEEPTIRKIIAREKPSLERSVQDTWDRLYSTSGAFVPRIVDRSTLDATTNNVIDGFYGLISSNPFPPDAATNAKLFIELGGINAYTWTLSPQHPMVSNFQGIIDLMEKNPDAITAVNAHELGHNFGFHIWAQVLWTAIAKEVGQVIIPEQDPEPGSQGGLPPISERIPAKVREKLTANQWRVINRSFSGLSRADLNARLSYQVREIIDSLREGRYGRTPKESNATRTAEERATRSLLARSIQNIGSGIRKEMGDERFLLFSAELAEQVVGKQNIRGWLGVSEDGEEESQGVKIDKKQAAFASRMLESHADFLAIAFMTNYYISNEKLNYQAALKKALDICMLTDAYLSSGKYASLEQARTQAELWAKMHRDDPTLEQLYWNAINVPDASHPDSIIRVGSYEIYSKLLAYKILTDPIYKSLWNYGELAQALQNETRRADGVSEPAFRLTHASGALTLQTTLLRYDNVLLPVFLKEADLISQNQLALRGSTLDRALRFFEEIAQTAYSEMEHGIYRFNPQIGYVLGQPTALFGKFVTELAKRIEKLEANESNEADLKKARALRTLMNAFEMTGAQVQRPDQVTELENQLKRDLETLKQPGATSVAKGTALVMLSGEKPVTGADKNRASKGSDKSITEETAPPKYACVIELAGGSAGFSEYVDRTIKAVEELRKVQASRASSGQ